MKKSRKIAIGSVAGAAILVGGVYVTSYFLAGNQVPAKANVNGVAIGGMTPQEAAGKLRSEFSEKAEAPIKISGVGRSATISPAEAGLSVDYDATVRSAGGGFSWNPLDIIATLAGGGEVTLVRSVDHATLSKAVEAQAGTFKAEAADATLGFKKGKIVRTQGRDAVQLDVAKTVDEVESAYRAGSADAKAVTQSSSPAVTNAMADQAVKEFAEPLLSGPVVVTHQAQSMRITTRQLASAASFKAEGGKLVGSIDGKELVKDTEEQQKALKLNAPKDATYSFAGGKPGIVPGSGGQVLDDGALAQAVAKAATASGQARTVQAPVKNAEPKVTTEHLKKVGDLQVIGQYTTYFPHAAYRNKNLGRAASMVNGSAIAPDEVFSLSKALGPRTPANGYTDGYVIDGGRLVKASGGGISQSATTLYNAAFFAGFKDVEHKPHSLYFDRYPAGREATLYEGKIDLKFQNNTKYPAVIQGAVSPSAPGKKGSITFRIWSKPTYTKIVGPEPQKYDFYHGATKTITTPGCENQAAIAGFSVRFQRLFYQGAQVVKRENYTWKYNAGDRIICQQTPAASGG